MYLCTTTYNVQLHMYMLHMQMDEIQSFLHLGEIRWADLIGLYYLPTVDAIQALKPAVVSMKVAQRDVLADGLDIWLSNRLKQLLPSEPGQLYGMLRVDPAFGLKKHEGEFRYFNVYNFLKSRCQAHS
jgi:hypothetical protein